MLENSEMFETNSCFDPNTLTHHHFHQNLHEIPNFSAINDQTPETHHHHQNFMMNMELNNNDQTPPDLLNLFQLPRCSSSISFSNPTQIDQAGYDPLLPLNFQPQPPFFRELINSLPNGFNCGSGFGEMDMERGEHSQLFHESDAVLEFGSGMINGKLTHNKDTKHFATEKHRRQQLNGKFDALKSLVPNPTKTDRASVVGDAIDYINELKRSVEELKILVDRKRCNRGRMKRHKTEDDNSTLDVESTYTRSNAAGGDSGHDQQAYNGNTTSTMRSSWLQRKSKNTEIDVRILDDEVTIKLVQQKRINCLLLVSKVLDELQLDLHHVAGGLIGDFYSYLFNTKICEGSSVYASAIANKLIEVVDKQYANIPVTSGY